MPTADSLLPAEIIRWREKCFSRPYRAKHDEDRKPVPAYPDPDFIGDCKPVGYDQAGNPLYGGGVSRKKYASKLYGHVDTWMVKIERMILDGELHPAHKAWNGWYITLGESPNEKRREQRAKEIDVLLAPVNGKYQFKLPRRLAEKIAKQVDAKPAASANLVPGEAEASKTTRSRPKKKQKKMTNESAESGVRFVEDHWEATGRSTSTSEAGAADIFNQGQHSFPLSIAAPSAIATGSIPWASFDPGSFTMDPTVLAPSAPYSSGHLREFAPDPIQPRKNLVYEDNPTSLSAHQTAAPTTSQIPRSPKPHQPASIHESEESGTADTDVHDQAARAIRLQADHIWAALRNGDPDLAEAVHVGRLNLLKMYAQDNGPFSNFVALVAAEMQRVNGEIHRRHEVWSTQNSRASEDQSTPLMEGGVQTLAYIAEHALEQHMTEFPGTPDSISQHHQRMIFELEQWESGDGFPFGNWGP